MAGFLARLLSSADSSVEAHVVAGLGVLAGYLGLAGYALATSADHHFDAQGFGLGAASIIAAIGGAGWLQGKGRQAQGDQSSNGA